MNCYFFFMSITILILYTTIQYAEGQKLTEEENELYDECLSSKDNNGTAFCYGDTEICVKDKSCLYLTTLIETDDVFHVKFLDRCNHTLKNIKLGQLTNAFFFGIGFATYDAQGNTDCSVPLEMKHFKLFLFWKNLKCPNEQYFIGNESKINELQIMKENWTSICEDRKNEIDKMEPPLEKEPLVFELSPYLQRHIYFSTMYGTWKKNKNPYTFSVSHKYFTHDGIYYSSNDTSADADLRRSKGVCKTYPLHKLEMMIIAFVLCILYC